MHSAVQPPINGSCRVATVLKRYKPGIKIVAVEPAESSVLSGRPPGPHKIEGVGIGYETLPFFHGQAARRGIETVLDLAKDLPPVRFSRNDLQHIVMNLVSNALEAMGDQGSRILISTRLEGEGAVLAVTDDGPGIPPDLLDKVQEPFFSTKHGGVGLASLPACGLCGPKGREISAQGFGR